MAAVRSGLARRYAEALFDVLGTDAQRREVLAILRRLSELWRQERGLRKLVAAPHIEPERRVEAAAHVLGAPLGHPLDFFLMMVLERRRHDVLALLPQAFEAVMDERAGVARIVVTTAAPLNDALRARLTRIGERLTGRRVSLDERVRPEVLGGVSLRVGDRVMDFTLRTLLSAMTEQLVSAPLSAVASGE